MGEAWLWLLFFLITACLMGMVICQLISLADLELDYINPYDSASRINTFILPEFITQGALCCLFLVTGARGIGLWRCLAFPILTTIYSRQEHLIDVTEIFNLLNREKKRRIFKIVYLFLFIFMSLFWLIYSALEDSE